MAVPTGMRVRANLTLTWPQVDTRRHIITLAEPKNYERQIIPLNNQASKSLRIAPRHMESPHVCCGQEGQPYHRVVKGFRQACRRAGITDFRFYDFRYTFASHLIMQGVPLRTVQELVGHQTGQMTLRYIHMSTPHLQQTVSMLETALLSAPGMPQEGLQK